jgi:hypothetical protein
MKPRRGTLLALLALPLALALTSCGGSSDASGTAADKSSSHGMAPADSGADSEAGGSTTGRQTLEGPAAKPATAREPLERSVIATAELRLTAKDLPDARQDAINLVTGLRGYVGDEQSQSDRRGALDRVDLTVRVPSASFEKALDGLAALGTVRHRQQSVEDVSTQVIDNAARVRAQRASVQSIQQLLARAKTIAEIMSIEAQLATRQADLDSLEQQQRYLHDQTSLSTIQLTLTHPPKATTPRPDRHDTGFLTGLERGWHALGDTVAVVGTGLGAALPFAAVLALLGVPAWLLVRRRRDVAAPAPAAEA